MIKVGDLVYNLCTGDIEIINDIQPIHNRYEIKGKSGWQYGLSSLQKLTNERIVELFNELKEDKEMYSKLFIEQQLGERVR